MRYLGSIKKLTSILLTKSGFNVTLSASTASASTEFQLPAAGGGTKAIVTEDASQTLSNKNIDANDNTISNIADANIVAAAGIDVTKLASGDVDNTEFSYLDGVTSSIQTQLGNKQDTSEKGAADGYASLDSGGKVPAAQLPSSLMTLEGTWNAATNTPTLIDGTGDSGMVYLVTVAGSQDLGSGSQTFAVGDWVLYNASGVWQQSNNSTSVASVNGYTGVVSLTKSDLSLGNVDDTSDATKNSAAVALTNKTLLSVDNISVDGNTVTTTSGAMNIESEATAAVNVTAGTDLNLTAGAGDAIWMFSDMILRPGKALRIQEPAGGPRAIDIVIPNTIAASRTLTLPDADGTVALVPGSGVVKSNGTVLTVGNVSLTSEVVGTLPVANGGTGQTSESGAINALVPPQAGNSGKFLTTNGTSVSWGDGGGSIPLGAVIATFHNLAGAYNCTATTAADSAGYVQCSGQTISDVTSPMNGVVIPNINNNTFLRGNSTSGSSGGAASITLTMSEIPQHSHGASGLTVSGSNSSSSVSGSTSNDGSHSHSFATAVGGNNNGMWHNSGGAPAAGDSQTNGSTAFSGGTHSHGSGSLTAAAQSWSGSVGGNTANAGQASPSSFSIIPTYITARYIMRVK